MKTILLLSLLVASSAFAQSSGQGKAATTFFPKSTQAYDAKKAVAKKDEAPCDTKEDILKKLEEEKKKQAEAGKGLSLQGKTDAGCTLK